MNITWAELKNRNPYLFNIIVEDTTRISYLQRLARELNRIMYDLFFPKSSYVEMTEEQEKAWGHLVPGNIYISTINPSYKWQDEVEEYEQGSDDGEWDMYQYHEAIEEEDAAAFREDERELEAEWAMHEQSYRHQRRRDLSEAAHQRQISELAAAMGYRQQDDGSYVNDWEEDVRENERKLRTLNKRLKLVFKYDRTRRERLYRGGISDRAAINESLGFESYRSRPGGFGISRQAKKLERRMFQAYEEIPWTGDRAVRKFNHLRRQLKRVKEQMAETKKYKGQSRFHDRFDWRFQLAMNAGEISAVLADDSADEYLIGCDSSDDWPFDEEEFERVSLTEAAQQSIANKRKRISELRSYFFPEDNLMDEWLHGSFNASLRSQINQLEIEINELQRELNPQT